MKGLIAIAGEPAPPTRRVHALASRLQPFVFPALVLGCFLLLTALGISGTSSTKLWAYLNGARPDPHLLAGMPRSVRSDEWFVNTPMVLGQHTAGYPRVNHHLAGGLDMSLVFDVPYIDWSLAFRPQSLGFLVLPLSQAFAFKWWLLPAVMLLGVYGLSLQLIPGKRCFAAFMAIAVLFSPFTQWWFTSSTTGTLGWGFVASAAFIWLLTAARLRDVILRSALLAYASACFGLVLYPAFQIPVLLVVLALALGIAVKRRRELSRAEVVTRLIAAAVAVTVAACVGITFFLTRSSAIRAITDTTYPGHRVTAAGGYSLLRLLYGSVTPVLAIRGASANVSAVALGGNDSEASAFLLVGVFLVAVQAWLVWRARSKQLPSNPLLIALLVLLAVFLADLFVPFIDPAVNLFGLGMVPHNRLHIGLGMLSTCLVLVTVQEIQQQNVVIPRSLAAGTLVGTFAVNLYEILQVRQVSVSASGGWKLSLSLLALATLITAAFITSRHRLGAGLLATFCLLGAGSVNPLYRGTFDIGNTALGAAVRKVDSGRPGAWISVAGLISNAVLVESGVHTYSGTFSYPTPGEWTELDPHRALVDVYNRYAQVVFTDGLTGPTLQNPQRDIVVVAFQPCGSFIQQRVHYVLSDHPITDSCVKLHEKVTMPVGLFYIYDVASLRPARPSALRPASLRP
ncbi:MAG: hypothetical protein JWO12_2886 [Frankiales bacterium]|nr:hypothetical protein [Frankiales bacterium]